MQGDPQARPGLSPSSPKDVLYCRVPRELHRAVAGVARGRGVSLTQVVNRALSYYLTDKCGLELTVEIPGLP